MTRVQTVGVHNLKDRLSSYLREIRSGSTLLITDRGTVVAELRRPSFPLRTPSSELLEDWVRDGRLSPPRTAKPPCPPSPVTLRQGTAAALLDQERSE